MLKKEKFLFGALTLTLGILTVLISCNHDRNKPSNSPDNPSVNSQTKELIFAINVKSGNGDASVLYNGSEVNVKDNVGMQVVLKKGVDFENAVLTAKLGNEEVKFSAFKDDWSGRAYAVCNDVKGVTDQMKEMKIRVTVGSDYDERSFNVKKFDEGTLDTDLTLTSFKIGEKEVDNIMSRSTYRLYDPSSNEIKFTAELSKNLKEAKIIINGKESTIELGADKKKAEKKIGFKKNSITRISFVFKAEGSKDVTIEPFAIVFTNTVYPTVYVQTVEGRPQEVHDFDLMSGELVYDKCTTTTPKIIIKAPKSGKRKITKVTVDGVDVNVETQNPGADEVYEATWTCNPPLEKAGESKTVKVHVEGGVLDDAGTFTEKEPWDFTVKFTLVQLIDASLQIKVGSGNFEDLKEEKRVYDQNVKIKVISKEDDLTDVVFKNYKDADGKIPDFEVTGKEAVASVKLADTGFVPSELTIIAKAEGKTDTKLTAHVRYTAKDDPLGVFQRTFGTGDVEPNSDPQNEPFRMTKEKATLYALVSRNCKRITSIKINNKEMLGQPAYSDPDQIVESAKFTAEQGQGGLSVNAVIVVGKDNMPLDHDYTLNISLEGETADGRRLTEAKLPPVKFRLPDYGNNCTDWRSPFSGGKDMDLLIVSKTHHPDDKAQLYYNYYGVQSVTAAVFPKNPRAKVEGFWYKGDNPSSELKKILEEQDKSKYEKNYIKFKEIDTIYGKCKWGFTLDFDSEDMKNLGIGLYLYVIAADGTTTNKKSYTGSVVDSPFWQLFRRLDISCSFEKLADDVAWGTEENPGWNKKMQVTDLVEIDNWDTNVKDNKLYFRATTYGWNESIEYHLFRDKETDSLPSYISEFKNIPTGVRHDNRFTVDVSTLTTSGSSLTVEIPVWLHNNNFSGNVFTRKFTIKRK